MSAAWIDHADRLPALDGRTPLGLDTEFMRRNTFHPKLALVQAAHGEGRWLLDPLAYDAGADVRALVEGRLCVMHSASEDLEALAPLLGDTVLDLFDTQIAAALCGMGPGLSYQKLVAGVLGVDIAKDETRSDWLQRPLTPGQLDYAEQDVVHLAVLHDRLAELLRQRGRTEWHAEDCARLVQRARRNQIESDPQPQRGFATAAGWRPEAQVRLRRVLRWRDTAARALDKPRPWVLDDAHALALADNPPGDASALFERVKGQRALRGPQRAELLELLQTGTTPDELETLAPIPPALKGERRRAADAMRDVVQVVATELDVPAGLLCPRRLLEEFVASCNWPDGLQGWRRGVLETRLSTLLPSTNA